MRSYVPDYNIVNPKDLEDALDLLDMEQNKWRPIAGGTDLLVLLNSGALKHKNFINIYNLKELKFFEKTDSYFRFGALTTYTDIIENSEFTTSFPLLVKASKETAARGIQNRGTIGGNIANASPAADSLPALLVYDAEIELISKNGVRNLSYQDFHTDYKKYSLNPGELIYGIKLPVLPRPTVSYFEKVGSRKALTISKLSLAGNLWTKDGVIENIKIALGSVAPTPVKLHKTEHLLKGKKITSELIKSAKEKLKEEISPIDDLRSNKEYRLKVSQNLLEDFLRKEQ